MTQVNPHEAEAIASLSAGNSTRYAAAETGMSQSKVSRLNKKHKVLINSEQAKLVEQTLSTITSRTIQEITTASHLTNVLTQPGGKDSPTINKTMLTDMEDINKFLARVDKKEEQILKSVGLLPSHAPSVLIQNILNDNRSMTISPVIKELISGRLKEIVGDDGSDEDYMTDADYEDIPDT